MEEAIPLVKKALGLLEGHVGRALDLGCGYGRNALFLAKKGFSVTAVDKDKESLEKVWERDKTGKIKTILSDIADFGYEGKYDLIICTFVLHFLPKEVAKKVVEEAILHLGKNGLLVIALIKQENRINREELREMIRDLEIKVFNEKKILDQPHRGAEYPHSHEVVFCIAKNAQK